MDVLIKSESEVSHEMEIVVPADELQPHFEKAYREHARDIVMPGFRKGKAPLQIIKRKFGPAIELETIEKLSDELFRQSIEERDIKPIGQPSVHDIDYKPGNPLTIKIRYETLPDIVAAEYTGIQLERLYHSVTDEEVDDYVLQLRKRLRTFEDAERPDEENYVVVIDLQILDPEGNPVPEKKRENMTIEMDDETLNRDLKAELLNMKVGEEKDIEITYEAGEDGEETSEKVRVKLVSVKKSILPDLDEEFISKVSAGKAANSEDFREQARRAIDDSWKSRYENMVENDLVNEIIKRNKVDVPPSIIEGVLEDMLENLKNAYPDKKLPKDFDMKAYRDESRDRAANTARWMFLRDSIIKQEGIVLEDADVEEKAAKEAERFGIAKENLIQYYKNSEREHTGILTDKLIAHLLSLAEIKDLHDDDISGTAFAPYTGSHQHHDHDHSHDHDHDHDEHTEEEGQEEKS